jgi:putative transposase
MVRAGVVQHPSGWETCGFHEIQEPPRRYRIIDREALAEALGLASSGELAAMHRHWIEERLQGDRQRQPWWSEALAVGSRKFVGRMHDELGVRGLHRIIEATLRLHIGAKTGQKTRL